MMRDWDGVVKLEEADDQAVCAGEEYCSPRLRVGCQEPVDRLRQAHLLRLEARGAYRFFLWSPIAGTPVQESGPK